MDTRSASIRSIGFRFGAFFAALAILCFTAAAAVSAQPVGTIFLITEGEAMLPPAPLEKAILPDGGPNIAIVKPGDVKSVAPPFEVDLKFGTGPSGKSIDYETFKATLLALWGIDLTDRIKPYLNKTDNRIYIKEAQVPLGNHRIKLTIADADGNITAKILKVNVR